MLFALILSLYSSMFYKNETYVFEHYSSENKSIPCEEVGSVCYQLNKEHFVKFDFLDGVNYQETHYYTKNIGHRFELIKENFDKDSSKTKVKNNTPYFFSYYDKDFFYEVAIEYAPDFTGREGKVVSISKRLSFFR